MGKLLRMWSCKYRMAFPNLPIYHRCGAFSGVHMQIFSVASEDLNSPTLELLRVDDDAAETRARGDLDLVEVQFARALGFGCHLFVAREARLRLDLAALGVAAHPLELGRDRRFASLASFLP